MLSLLSIYEFIHKICYAFVVSCRYCILYLSRRVGILFLDICLRHLAITKCIHQFHVVLVVVVVGRWPAVAVAVAAAFHCCILGQFWSTQTK